MNTQEISNKKGRGAKTSPPNIKLGLLNLMPTKEKTDVSFINIFNQYKSPVDIFRLKFDSYTPVNVNKEYFKTHYSSIWSKIDILDALIITGTPVEELPFEEVKYWEEAKKLFDYCHSIKIPMYLICWSAQAALNHYYAIEKKVLKKKIFDVYPFQYVASDKSIFKRCDQPIYFPASRHSESDIAQIKKNNNLKIILNNELDEGGLFLMKDLSKPIYYVFGHGEYATNDLKDEYYRDLKRGRTDVDVPKHYNLDNPINNWSDNALTLYHSWLSEST